MKLLAMPDSASDPQRAWLSQGHGGGIPLLIGFQSGFPLIFLLLK